ncbi:MAG: hypothetical protein GW778_05135 [Alphaproteobacteria bacterium]|nr:hypothetical protein [Alphaproteobacteria bacterium]
MGTYQDHSQIIVDDPNLAKNAQTALIDLGMNLGPAGADGQWGQASIKAATQWQEINGYEPTGQITSRQMDSLNFQAEHPSVFNRMQLQPFYENFAANKIPTTDPVRLGMIMQAASHVGAQEFGGDNQGPAVEQYLTSDGRIATGVAWCAAYGSWGIDQVENFAGIPNNEYMQANMRVQELHDNIASSSPEAIKNPTEYTPQPADMLLKLRDNGTGHYATIIDAIKSGDGYTEYLTIDGNIGNDGEGAVTGNRFATFTDENTGKSYLVNQDDPEAPYVDYSEEMAVIDISELPNYDKMQAAFNTNNTFVPTPSADPNFKPNLDMLAEIEQGLDVFEEYRQSQQPTLPPLDYNAGVQMSANNAFNTAPGG